MFLALNTCCDMYTDYAVNAPLLNCLSLGIMVHSTAQHSSPAAALRSSKEK